ncbi:hypothetical protein [Aquimarina algiphila]|uniref:hypothetical protein n=1 Tax=Aquimarina algiphila TaxID=2047982 RepID=UPI002493A42F|nr:hypothetical protein [Aquimarina algiphila]
MKRILKLSAFSIFIILSSCNNDIDKGINALDKAIIQIKQDSDNWRNHIAMMQKNLTTDVKDIIGNDIQLLMNNSIGMIGVELKCQTDFSTQRVTRELKRMKIKLLGIKLKDYSDDYKEVLEKNPELKESFMSDPHVCHPSLTQWDRAKNIEKIDYYGYDFFVNNIIAEAELDNKTTINISKYISLPSKYILTLNIYELKKELPETVSAIILRDKTRTALSGISVIDSNDDSKIPKNIGIKYRVRQAGHWTAWKKNGEVAGQGGNHNAIDLVEIQLINSGSCQIKGFAHWQTKGDFGPITGKELNFGSSGKRFESLMLCLIDCNGYKIQYKGHIQDLGDVPFRDEDCEDGWLAERFIGKRLEELSILIKEE